MINFCEQNEILHATVPSRRTSVGRNRGRAAYINNYQSNRWALCLGGRLPVRVLSVYRQVSEVVGQELSGGR